LPALVFLVHPAVFSHGGLLNQALCLVFHSVKKQKLCIKTRRK